jgi:quercetin dioxygenase-like cupin family protein
MAYSNKTISNPKTGQIIRFLRTAKETSGKYLEMESIFQPGSKEPPAHYHPYQEEKFKIISGELTVKLNGNLKVYTTGEILSVPNNTVHSMWNQSGSTTVVHWHVTPALDTEYFFETMMGLAEEGKTNKEGVPGILQIALLANKYANIFRFSKPPFIVQKILFYVLTPFAYLAGYKNQYEKYLN